jgi:Na+-transporting NADH:ubiquinone oxidoreductase subunit B
MHSYTPPFPRLQWPARFLSLTPRAEDRYDHFMKSPVAWQPPMKRVLIALIPATAAAVYFFGWRALVLLAAVNLAGFLTEFLFARASKAEVSSAVFVSCFLFTLSLPPALPVWIAVVGIAFGILFGKMAYGGFGRNAFNPALVGRVFIYVSFGAPMTARWVLPLAPSAGSLMIPSSWGGFARFAADAASGPTPLRILRGGGRVDLLPLLWGNVAGCLGETSALLLVLGGLYIIWKKAANWRIVVSQLAAFLLLQAAFSLAGVRHAPDPLTALLSGGAVLGILFMATDPVSAAQTQPGRWIYGALVGALIVLIRTFSIWPEGTMFAILLGNTFAPIFDYFVREAKAKKKAAPAVSSAKAG